MAKTPLEMLAQVMAEMAGKHQPPPKPVRSEGETKTIFIPPPAGGP